MGQVYAARHDVYGTSVALKVLHASLHADPGWRARFNEEGLVGTQLKHPHILSARELVAHEGRIALVLDLVSGGQTLEKVISREFADGLTTLQAMKVFLAIVQGVEYLHGKSIVHGDLKPENVLLQGELRSPDSWTVRVTDFGTIGLIAHPVLIDGRAAVVATPRYASPEHLLGVDHIEPRSDVYALGLILHYLLTGKHASSARTVQDAVPVVSQPLNVTNLVDQPELVLELFRRATAVRPDDRYPNCRELALGVRAVLDAMGAPLELEDLQADLATEVDEGRQQQAVSQAAELTPDAPSDEAPSTAQGAESDTANTEPPQPTEERFPPFTAAPTAPPAPEPAPATPPAPTFAAATTPPTPGWVWGAVAVGVVGVVALVWFSL
jgi:serine/threonine protein kinase